MRIIITENQFRRLYGEQTTKPQYSWQNNPAPSYVTAPSDYLGKGGQFERSQNMSDLRNMPIKNGPKKGSTTLDAAMEQFRDGLFSPAGMAIEAFLSAFAFTAPAVLGAYAAMLAYDIYKSLNGEINWLNIIFDTFSVATSGTASKLFAPYVKQVKSGTFNTIAKAFEWIKTTKLWQALKPIITAITNGLKVVSKWITTGLKWIADNTGITAIANFGSKIVSFIDNSIESITKNLSGLAEKVVTNPKVVSKVPAVVQKTVKSLTPGTKKVVTKTYTGVKNAANTLVPDAKEVVADYAKEKLLPNKS
jgi:hypothetical protein